MDRAYYTASIHDFLIEDPGHIVGRLAAAASQEGVAARETQLEAWHLEIEVLKESLWEDSGSIYFEYSIPRLGRRIDAVLVTGPLIFALEFKAGQTTFTRAALDQVWDYGLDLKNFHETSHHVHVAPVLVATDAADPGESILTRSADDLFEPIRATPSTLSRTLQRVLRSVHAPALSPAAWEQGRYRPTPTIIEAARALYANHSVKDITRREAGAMNLAQTSETVSAIIEEAAREGRKAICFVTGVPGSGKTLVGLDVATKYSQRSQHSRSVYLSGNGPLVAVLREALARDQVNRTLDAGGSMRLGEARGRVKAFIQNVHHFRDECLRDEGPPDEHVAIFDEAQRAWTMEKTALFMRQRKKRRGFSQSEPAFLVSCLDRHSDWAVVVCLVGGGQEINTGEAGITEWVESVAEQHHWQIYLSPQLHEAEYGAGSVIDRLKARPGLHLREELHLATSMRSYRAENLSNLVKQLLDLETDAAKSSLASVKKYPMVLTRELDKAKAWLRQNARGTERYGLVVSSQAERLKPHAINVKAPLDPVHYFLDDKEDVRSSFYLEDAATEFQVQGLEMDWTCVAWDADFRHNGTSWEYWSFKGKRWEHIRSEERKRYLKNAYRVLLTRGRQGMVIAIPPGDPTDPTREPWMYDATFEYLRGLGFPVL